MRISAPAIFTCTVLGGLITTALLPGARSDLWSLLQSNPNSLWCLGLLIVPVAFYGLWLMEMTPKRADRPHHSDSAALAEARVALEKQLGQFLQLLNDQGNSTKRHGSTLNLLNDRLSGASSESELREIIEQLIASNEAHRKETAVLEHRLEQAQSQANELRLRAKKAEKLASLDPLTNVANRRKFEDELAKQVALSHEDELPLTLIMIDIDHFKDVNDLFGHRTGDAVLRQFAELMSAVVRNTDVVARYGGEEFAIVLPRAPLGNAYEIAERLRATIENRRWQSQTGAEFQLTCSAGIADIRDGETPVDLVNRADQMLYEAKRRGRNRTIIASALPQFEKAAS